MLQSKNHITQFFKKEYMARISSEKAAIAIGNRYDLVLIVCQRIRELNSGHKPKLETQNGNTITALREIEEGLIGREYLKRIRKNK